MLLARLKWRSHFIQKFESNCYYEKDFINKGYQKIVFDSDKIIRKMEKRRNGLSIS